MNENKECHNLVLMGDFNFPQNDWTNEEYPSGNSNIAVQTRMLLDITDKWFMTNQIKKPTRDRNILELVFSNNDTVISEF